MAIRRFLVPLTAVALALALSMTGCGDSSDGTTATTAAPPGPTTTTSSDKSGSTTTLAGAPKPVEIVVAGGKVEGGAQRHKVTKGEQVTVRVTSDVADLVHIHGYDLEGEVHQGHSVALSFVADIAGVFEIELENAKLRLGELAVS